MANGPDLMGIFEDKLWLVRSADPASRPFPLDACRDKPMLTLQLEMDGQIS